ncbi:hypothetical protein OCU04_010816 [Sclerotinia nivalis]|uniref:Uncharacterized protein n=1 Tax=Sclerotinia nivalis TaxID=352851 RepID=A0A9X0ACW2_9HELO|nr:hypothetical protein OCU04_010816 [Sclerotinia nivalis]
MLSETQGNFSLVPRHQSTFYVVKTCKFPALLARIRDTGKSFASSDNLRNNCINNTSSRKDAGNVGYKGLSISQAKSTDLK